MSLSKNLLFLLVTLVVVAAVVIAGCAAPTPSPTPTPSPSPSPSPTSSPSPTPSPSPTETVYEWRLQHRWTAAESFYIEQYADIVRGMSGGRIDITVYAGDELLPGDDVPEALAMGTLDMAMFHPGNFMGTVPVASIETIPFLWKSFDEFVAIHYELGLQDVYREAFRDTYDIHMLAVFPDDYGMVMWVDDFSCLADLKGRKAKMTGVLASILEPYGISAVSIPGGDIYTSLATGVIDGVSYGGALCNTSLGFHEVAKYFMKPYENIAYSPAYFINEELWAELPSDLQDILMQAVYANGMFVRGKYVAGEDAALSQAVAEFGCKVVTLPDEDIQAISAGAMEELYKLEDEYPEAADGVAVIENALKLFGYIT